MLTPLRGFEGNYRITITGSHHLKVAVCFCTYSAGPSDTRRSSRQIRRADCWLSLLIPDADNQIAAAPSCQYRLHAEDLKSCVRIPGFLEFTSRPFHDATGTFLVKHPFMKHLTESKANDNIFQIVFRLYLTGVSTEGGDFIVFLTVLGIIISLAGVACRFYGKYTSHNVFLLLNSLFKHGIIDPGALWKSIGNFLIVIGVVLIVVGIGIKRNGFGFSRQSDDEDFDYLDDCPDSDDYYD